MPFKSKAQRAWMHINHPEMAKRWEKHTSKGKKLPQRVAKHEDSMVESFIEKLDAILTMDEKKDNWIKDATKNKGGLHRSLGVPEGQKIPAKKISAATKRAKPGSTLDKQLTLAKNLKKMH